jgi:hypothetical protein
MRKQDRERLKAEKKGGNLKRNAEARQIKAEALKRKAETER